MIPCCETKDGTNHARAGNKTLCGKEFVGRFDIAIGQWGEKDEEYPPLRWCRECEGFLTARGFVVPKATVPVAVVEPVKARGK